jgi:hypothetical protein
MECMDVVWSYPWKVKNVIQYKCNLYRVSECVCVRARARARGTTVTVHADVQQTFWHILQYEYHYLQVKIRPSAA